MPKRKPRFLDLEQIIDAHGKTIGTGMRLTEVAMKINTDYPEVALSLFQIAQEEIGKSFLLLAACGYERDCMLWNDFWCVWRTHERKIAASFFYEWLCPTRGIVIPPQGEPLDGFTKRKRFSAEKEAGLYVDYDEKTGRFVAPREEALEEEATNRGVSVISHISTASFLKHALDEGDKLWNYRVFSEIPKRVLNQLTRQEQTPSLFADLASRSDRHNKLVIQIQTAIKKGASTLEDTFRKAKAQREPAKETKE
jgi:AbiV family abortive infection protein